MRGWFRHSVPDTFPQEWRELLHQRFAHWDTFSADETDVLEELLLEFLASKRFEPGRDLEMAIEHRVLIAAMACVPILGLSLDEYRNVRWIVVLPTRSQIGRPTALSAGGRVVSHNVAFTGLAERGAGSVLLAWDRVTADAATLHGARNLVYHEFAHKIDGIGRGPDGVPLMSGEEARQRWTRECTAVYESLLDREDEILRPYAATSPAEFFAVCTETFLCAPVELRRVHPALYDVFCEFYRQDPALRLPDETDPTP
jgi:Mlc titration factor MtfA (ptsG expression regulator)